MSRDEKEGLHNYYDESPLIRYAQDGMLREVTSFLVPNRSIDKKTLTMALYLTLLDSNDFSKEADSDTKNRQAIALLLIKNGASEMKARKLLEEVNKDIEDFSFRNSDWFAARSRVPALFPLSGIHKLIDVQEHKKALQRKNQTKCSEIESAITWLPPPAAPKQTKNKKSKSKNKNRRSIKNSRGPGGQFVTLQKLSILQQSKEDEKENPKIKEIQEEKSSPIESAPKSTTIRPRSGIKRAHEERAIWEAEQFLKNGTQKKQRCESSVAAVLN